MPAKKKLNPSYRSHHSGKARVTFDGRLSLCAGDDFSPNSESTVCLEALLRNGRKRVVDRSHEKHPRATGSGGYFPLQYFPNNFVGRFFLAALIWL